MNKILSNNMCRICFDITSESYCNCKGSIKYIHKSCLVCRVMQILIYLL